MNYSTLKNTYSRKNYSTLKNTYSRKNERNESVEHFTSDSTSVTQIRSNWYQSTVDPVELNYPLSNSLGSRQNYRRILSPTKKWKLELNQDGLQLIGPYNFVATIAGDPTYNSYKLTIDKKSNLTLFGSKSTSSIVVQSTATNILATAARSESPDWTLNVDDNGNISINNSAGDSNYLFNSLSVNQSLYYNDANNKSQSIVSSSTNANSKWKLELVSTGLQLKNLYLNQTIQVYKRNESISPLILSLNNSGQLVLKDNGTLVWKTKSFPTLTLDYKMSINPITGSLDIKIGEDLKWGTVIQKLTQEDILNSDEYRYIVSDNGYYRLVISRDGLNVISNVDNVIVKNIFTITLSTDTLYLKNNPFGEIKVYKTDTTENNCVWIAGTSEKTQTSPYSIKVSNIGNIISENKEGKIFPYKKLDSFSIPETAIIIKEKTNNKYYWNIDTYADFLVGKETMGDYISNPGSIWTLNDGKLKNKSQGCLRTNHGQLEAKDAQDHCNRIFTLDANGYIGVDGKYLAYTDSSIVILVEKSAASVWDVIPILNTYITNPADSNCFFSSWSNDIDECTLPCGTGKMKKTRVNISPKKGAGSDCFDNLSEKTVDCNTQVCPPVNCAVSDWYAWSDCSKPCGGGTQTQSKTVITPSANGGTPCPPLTQEQTCNPQACPPPVDCAVSDWYAWSDCSKPCGGGTQSQTRTVTKPSANGGAVCPTLTQEQTCNPQACPPPVDCAVSDWSDWSSCSKPCGEGGKRSKMRTVTKPRANGGTACPPLEEIADCDTTDCTPSPSADGDFLSKYKWLIIGGVVGFILFLLILVLLMKK